MKTYVEIKAGQPANHIELVAHIKTFPHVILYGAAALGQAVKATLDGYGITIDGFWDLRHYEIAGAVEPYTTGDPSDTLVILCVGNTILQPEIVKELQEHGYENILLGDLVYQSLGCPLTDRVDGDACLRGPCRAIYCKRLQDIVKANCPPKEAPPLFLHSVTFVTGQICSLQCEMCTSYLGHYSPDQRENFPARDVIRDIDAFMNAVDGVGTITIMGGESFLHPDLGDIVEALMKHKNFGVMSISTNGVCKITDQQLEKMHDHRMNVSFSNYLSALNDHQQHIFWDNVAKLKAACVPYTVGNPGVTWIVPSTLNKETVDEGTMIQRKKDCDPVRCMQVKDGKLFPCDFIQSVHSLELEDDPGNYVDLSRGDLREAIREFWCNSYYPACARCKGCGGTVSIAGKQGFADMWGSQK